MGDAVYELAMREFLLKNMSRDGGSFKIHSSAIRYVSSAGQAVAAKGMCSNGFLTEKEERILKRARNHRATSKPHNADPKNYKWATGLEALVGYLYLAEEKERLQEVLDEAVRLIGENNE